MKPVIATLVLAVVIGLVSGGRMSGLSSLRLRWAPLALVGLGLQFLLPPGNWPLVLLMVSFVLLTIFAIRNLKVAGFPLILVGVLMNFLVIGVNGGMPVPRHALEASDQMGELQYLIDHGGAKHHLATSEDSLMFLADVIPLGAPVRQAISLGDIFAYIGVAQVVVAAMRTSRRGRPRTAGERSATLEAGAPGG
jgi:hypothetical protein